MKLKDRIQNDFIVAMKAKDENAKIALSGLKAKITEAEKANGNVELSEDDLIKVINKAIKQREESEQIYQQAGRQDMAQKEADEVKVLRTYMPSQMTLEEIEPIVFDIIENLKSVTTNRNALIGKAMGEFNKNYQGKADLKVVSSVIHKILIN